MSMSSEDIKGIKATLQQILKNQTVVMAHLANYNSTPKQQQKQGTYAPAGSFGTIASGLPKAPPTTPISSNSLPANITPQVFLEALMNHGLFKTFLTNAGSPQMADILAKVKRESPVPVHPPLARTLSIGPHHGTPRLAPPIANKRLHGDKISLIEINGPAPKRRGRPPNQNNSMRTDSRMTNIKEDKKGSEKENKQQKLLAAEEKLCSLCDTGIRGDVLVQHTWEHIKKKLTAEKGANLDNMYSFVCSVEGCKFRHNTMEIAFDHAEEAHPDLDSDHCVVDNSENTDPLFKITVAHCYATLTDAEKDQIYQLRHL